LSKSCGDPIHAVPENIVVLDHDVADIDADPEAHPSRFGLAFIGSLKRRLDLDCTANRIEHTHEFGEHAVASGVRNPPSMPGDQLVDDATTGRQCRHCRFFVAVHQATIALNICCEDRREAPFQFGCFHIQISIAQAPGSVGSNHGVIGCGFSAVGRQARVVSPP